MATLLGNIGLGNNHNMMREIWNRIPDDYRRNWMGNHMTHDDPFGMRPPNQAEQDQMVREWTRERDMRMNNDMFTTLDTTATRNADPLNYQDLLQAQEQMRDMQNVGTARGVHVPSTGDLNDYVRRWFEANHPEEENYLQRFANEHRLSPLQAILALVHFAKDNIDTEPTTLNSINKELKQLERNKKDELANQIFS